MPQKHYVQFARIFVSNAAKSVGNISMIIASNAQKRVYTALKHAAKWPLNIRE